MSHSILLIQPSTPETRTYSDYESVNDCLEGVCRIYEEHLKRRNPNTVRCCHDDTLISYNRTFFMFTANNHLRYQPAIWLRRSTQGLERFGLSEINKHLCSLQQRLDQGKDLRFVAESSWNILSWWQLQCEFAFELKTFLNLIAHYFFYNFKKWRINIWAKLINLWN